MSIRARTLPRAAPRPTTNAQAIDTAPDADTSTLRSVESERIGPVATATSHATFGAPGPLAAAPLPGVGLLVGECTAAHDPTRPGQIRVHFTGASGSQRELWMPTLQGLAVRARDRVLLGQPGNCAEPVVLGVLEGAAKSPELSRQPDRALALRPDESITITDSAGTPLVEIVQSEGGPTLRVLASQVSIDMAGKLLLSAESIELRARAGSATVLATEDVVIRGENVRLN